MLPCNDDVPIMELALPCGGEGSCQSFETRGYFGPYPVAHTVGERRAPSGYAPDILLETDVRAQLEL